MKDVLKCILGLTQDNKTPILSYKLQTRDGGGEKEGTGTSSLPNLKSSINSLIDLMGTMVECAL